MSADRDKGDRASWCNLTIHAALRKAQARKQLADQYGSDVLLEEIRCRLTC